MTIKWPSLAKKPKIRHSSHGGKNVKLRKLRELPGKCLSLNRIRPWQKPKRKQCHLVLFICFAWSYFQLLEGIWEYEAKKQRRALTFR